MKRIDPTVLKSLREAKGWTQEMLAEKTKAGSLPKVDKQTVSRLERGIRAGTRGRTIEQIARALNVDPAVLTGEAPLPKMQSGNDSVDPGSQLNVRVGTAARNALTLVARRYGVPPSHIVELAPLLFVWAAEKSLRERQEDISEVERACEIARHLEEQIRHLPIPNFTYSEERIAAETASIGRRDLFGSTIGGSDFLDPYYDLEPGTENPFAMFLRNLMLPFRNVAEFDAWSEPWPPVYRVCPDEAAEIVGGDLDRASEIVSGLVALTEMPKELRKPGMVNERSEWIRLKAEERRRESTKDGIDLADLGLQVESRGP